LKRKVWELLSKELKSNDELVKKKR